LVADTGANSCGSSALSFCSALSLMLVDYQPDYYVLSIKFTKSVDILD